MQNNYSYGPIVGFLIFVVIAAVILAVGAAGTYGPEQQAVSNRINAEVEYLRGKYAQELASSQAQLDAAIANAPALAQLELTRKADELAQQRQDFELNSVIKQTGTIGFLVLVAAAVVAVAVYAATRESGSRTTNHAPAGTAIRRSPGQRAASRPEGPLAGSKPPGLQPHPATTAPAAPAPSHNGQNDPRWQAYRQLIEQNHAATALAEHRLMALEHQLMPPTQQLTDTQPAMGQAIREIQSSLAAITTQINELQTTLRQLEARIPPSHAQAGPNNGQNEHIFDGREVSRTNGYDRNTGTQFKEVPDTNTQIWRRAA